MAEHQQLATGEIHIPYQWSYADATARLAATGFVIADVGKLARQLDDNSLWMLTDDSPETWIAIASAGAAVTSVNTQTGAVVLDADDIADTATNVFATPAELTKLAGIEALADVTDATNVDAAGATMNADTTLAGNGYFLDEDDMVSNSATKVPSQQSTKAYVDAQVAGGGYTNEMAQDAVGTILADSTNIDFTYTDGTPEITADLTTIAKTSTINYIFDGGGSEIADGVNGWIKFSKNGTITAWDLTGQPAGAMVVDMWKDTYANFPPTVADTMTGAEKPTITATSVKGQDTSLNGGAGWNIDAGDYVMFNVDSCTTITKADLALTFVAD